MERIYENPNFHGCGAVPLLSSGVSWAQTATMMEGGNSGFGWMGGYGGWFWMPLLLIVVVVALVVMLVRSKDK